MGARENLQRLADRKREEVVELEKQLDRANAYLQAIQDSLKAIPRENANTTGRIEDQQVLRSGTILAKAREAIMENGSPMHVNQILTRLGMNVEKNTRVSLVGSIGTYVRRGIIFTRPGPNIFGLVDMDANDQKSMAVSLPAGFGVVGEDGD